MRAIRGARIGMIFQEPMTALNPLHARSARQIEEVLEAHADLPPGDAARRVRALLERRRHPRSAQRRPRLSA